MTKAKRNAVQNGKAAPAARPKSTRRGRQRKIPYFGRTKSIEEIARDQGKVLRPWTDEDFKWMVKLGKGLFRNRKELEDFIADIYEQRRQSRGP